MKNLLLKSLNNVSSTFQKKFKKIIYSIGLWEFDVIMTTVKQKNSHNSLQLPSLDELAKSQGVDPSFDVSALFGTWPGEPDDGFEEMIHKHRLQDVAVRKINE